MHAVVCCFEMGKRHMPADDDAAVAQRMENEMHRPMHWTKMGTCACSFADQFCNNKKRLVLPANIIDNAERACLAPPQMGKENTHITCVIRLKSSRSHKFCRIFASCFVVHSNKIRFCCFCWSRNPEIPLWTLKYLFAKILQDFSVVFCCCCTDIGYRTRACIFNSFASQSKRTKTKQEEV